MVVSSSRAVNAANQYWTHGVYKLGDVNGDGKRTMADVAATFERAQPSTQAQIASATIEAEKANSKETCSTWKTVGSVSVLFAGLASVLVLGPVLAVSGAVALGVGILIAALGVLVAAGGAWLMSGESEREKNVSRAKDDAERQVNDAWDAASDEVNLNTRSKDALVQWVREHQSQGTALRQISQERGEALADEVAQALLAKGELKGLETAYARSLPMCYSTSDIRPNSEALEAFDVDKKNSWERIQARVNDLPKDTRAIVTKAFEDNHDRAKFAAALDPSACAVSLAPRTQSLSALLDAARRQGGSALANKVAEKALAAGNFAPLYGYVLDTSELNDTSAIRSRAEWADYFRHTGAPWDPRLQQILQRVPDAALRARIRSAVTKRYDADAFAKTLDLRGIGQTVIDTMVARSLEQAEKSLERSFTWRERQTLLVNETQRISDLVWNLVEKKGD